MIDCPKCGRKGIRVLTWGELGISQTSFCCWNYDSGCDFITFPPGVTKDNWQRLMDRHKESLTKCLKPKTALMSIEFEDGSTTEIKLNKAFEIDIPPTRKQSIAFAETKNGWLMSFTKPLFEGKKFKEIKITKV